MRCRAATIDQAFTGWFDDMVRIYGEMVESQRRLAGALLGAGSPFFEAGRRSGTAAAHTTEHLTSEVLYRGRRAGREVAHDAAALTEAASHA